MTASGRMFRSCTITPIAVGHHGMDCADQEPGQSVWFEEMESSLKEHYSYRL